MNLQGYWIVDRVSDGVVVLEGDDNAFIRVDADELPIVVEGGLYRMEDDCWFYDEAATQQRRQEMQELTKNFFVRKKD